MLSVNNLQYSYSGTKTQAIKGITFDIQPGEVFGFLGPSGSGKTTTQRIVIGLLRGYHGSVKVFEQERRTFGREFFEKIGVAFDFPNLYLKLTAAENLALISSYYKNSSHDVDAFLDMVGLLPERNKKVENFSKGMKMRLNFVRSIMHDPDMLFFDEPTSGLDPVNAKIIKNIILQLKREGKTIFLTTHNMNVAEQLCDRVAFLCEGRISLCDSPSNLKVRFGKRIAKVEYLQDGKTVADEFSLDDLAQEFHFFDILKTKKILTLHSQDASLEDIFIKVTGRSLL